MAVIYVVRVPQESKYSYIEKHYVPELTNLIHDPGMFGFSEELDREQKNRVKKHFQSWVKYTLSDRNDQAYSVEYLHIETIGIIPNLRSNAWMTFANQEDAECYLQAMIEKDLKPSREHLAFVSLLEDLSDEFLRFDEYDGEDR